MSQTVEDHRRRGRGRGARLALAGVMTAGALVAVPVAQADSLSNVRVHVRGADAALHTVIGAAAVGASVSGSLGLLEAQLHVAGKSSAKLYVHAHTPKARFHAATALLKIAAQENRDATILTPLIGQVTDSSQADLAKFVASATQGREQALTLVTGLLPKLPVPDVGGVAGTVAELSNVGTGQVGQLASIAPLSIACPAIDAVSQVVATVVTSVQADLSRVQSMLSLLPPGAAGQFTSVVNGLPAQLTSLIGSLKTAFNCDSATIVGGAGATVGTLSGVLGSVTQLVHGLLSSFLPGVGLGTTPSAVPIPAPVSGLLGQVTGLIPGLGSLLGGTVTGSGSANGGGALGGLISGSAGGSGSASGGLAGGGPVGGLLGGGGPVGGLLGGGGPLGGLLGGLLGK